MPLEFITLKDTDPKADPNYTRTSHLSISDNYEGLRVGGVLSHGSTFEPNSVADARRLVEWLDAWIERAEISGLES